jgi:4-alpha-glucanotransferase
MKAYNFKRQSGILLHPTSLPNNQGIGTIGKEAKDFLDFCCQAGARLWQVCPLGPTGYGDSPYQCFSSVAGNPMLVDLEDLVKRGFLHGTDLAPLAALPRDRVDFGSLIPKKWDLLRKAYNAYKLQSSGSTRDGAINAARFDVYCRDNKTWLPDFALFMALKGHFGGASWNTWPLDIRNREPVALSTYQAQLDEEIRFNMFVQWIFASQWNDLHAYAKDRGIHILGDMPIFVAIDSSDVWTRRDLFQLDEVGNPLAVAGVPPDYFSPTGQLWGNPLYNWDAMHAENYQWWIDTIAQKLAMYDYLRIDHFRGFAAYWSVPFGDLTAINGKWIKAPGKELFRAVMGAIGSAPIIAEDLGLITPDVGELMEHFGFPGMKVLQFAFDSSEDNDHVPHNYKPHSLVYTGTHDNDTVKGWYYGAKEDDKVHTRKYLSISGSDRDIHWEFIRAAMSTVCNIAVIPVQDVLGCGREARMNLPGSMGGNWTWRYEQGELKTSMANRFRGLAKLYGRL